MKSETLKRIRFLLIGIFMFAAAATEAQQASSTSRFSMWDKDHNKRLTHAEFYEGMEEAGLFEAWDRNGDLLLNRQEVNAGRARMQQVAANRNESSKPGAGEGDGFVGASIQEGSFSFSDTETGFSFREVDLNRDGTLNKTEFFTALFRLWDQEQMGYLRKHELREARLRKWLLM